MQIANSSTRLQGIRSSPVEADVSSEVVSTIPVEDVVSPDEEVPIPPVDPEEEVVGSGEEDVPLVVPGDETVVIPAVSPERESVVSLPESPQAQNKSAIGRILFMLKSKSRDSKGLCNTRSRSVCPSGGPQSAMSIPRGCRSPHGRDTAPRAPW